MAKSKTVLVGAQCPRHLSDWLKIEADRIGVNPSDFIRYLLDMGMAFTQTRPPEFMKPIILKRQIELAMRQVEEDEEPTRGKKFAKVMKAMKPDDSFFSATAGSVIKSVK